MFTGYVYSECLRLYSIKIIEHKKRCAFPSNQGYNNHFDLHALQISMPSSESAEVGHKHVEVNPNVPIILIYFLWHPSRHPEGRWF